MEWLVTPPQVVLPQVPSGAPMACFGLIKRFRKLFLCRCRLQSLLTVVNATSVSQLCATLIYRDTLLSPRRWMPPEMFPFLFADLLRLLRL